MEEELSPDQMDRITDALAGGRKIEAIKIYREATGKGLKESKDFLDALAPRLREQDPQMHAQPPAAGSGGCAPVLLLLAALWAAAVAWTIG